MPFALRPGTMITGYEVVRPIGAGGFGITYEGYNPITERRVAIKEFFPRGIASRDDATRIAYSKQDDEVVTWALKRFAESTNRLAKLKHPNIIEVLNYVSDNGTGYMVMEHVEGQTLEDWLKARTTPPQLAELGPIFDPIFDALEYVHANGLIHRDIAPDNIMIRGDGRPVLIDFGALKIIAEHTQAHGPSPKSFGVVKVNYSPPEQSDDGGTTDPRMDVYSLSATIYRALAGKPPVDADKRKTDIALKGIDPYVSLATAAQAPVPPQFSATIDAALSLRPKERPASIAELRAQLAAREAAPAAPAATTPVPMEPATVVIPATALSETTAAIPSSPAAPAPDERTGSTYSAPPVQPYTPTAGGADPGQGYTPPGNETPRVKRSGMSFVNLAAVVLVLVGALGVLLHRPVLNLLDRMMGMRFTMGQEETLQQKQTPQKQPAPQKQQAPQQQQQPPQQQTKRDTQVERVPQQPQQPPQQQPQQKQQVPSREAEALLTRANQSQRAGDNRKAIEEYSDAIRLDPSLVNAYTGRGLSYYRTGDRDRAFDDYTTAIRLEPNTRRASVPYLNRAIVWRERGNAERAFEDIEQALRLDPKFSLAFNTRGNLHYDRREYDRALADYNEAITLDPSYAQAYANRGNVHAARRDPQRALDDYSTALRLDPRNVNALVGRGNAYDDLKDGDRAIKDYTEALRLDRMHALAYFNRARIYLARKDYISALSDYSDAVRLDPRRATAHQGRGLANEALGRREEAIKDFREALRLDSSLTTSRDALRRLGVNL
jgi:serine/threonine protein kinase/Tfp pilus assembly protein PilF